MKISQFVIILFSVPLTFLKSLAIAVLKKENRIDLHQELSGVLPYEDIHINLSNR